MWYCDIAKTRILVLASSTTDTKHSPTGSISDSQADSCTTVSSMGKLLLDIQGDKEKKPNEDTMPADFLFNKTCCAFRRLISPNTPDFPRHRTVNEQLSVERGQSRCSTIQFTGYFCVLRGSKTDLKSISSRLSVTCTEQFLQQHALHRAVHNN